MNRALVVAICLLVLPASRAEAWNPLRALANKIVAAGRAIGGVFGAPVGGFVEAAATPVIHSAEDTGHRLIADVDHAIASNLDRTGVMIKDTVTQVDLTLGARILQIQTTADHAVDHATERIDLLIGRLEVDVKQVIERAEKAGHALIKQLDDAIAKNLRDVDQILATHINDLQVAVSSSIQQADDAARQRLEQADEIAGRRIGNLDVIATKQSLALEGMLVRIAALVGVLGLIAFVAWRLFRELADAVATANERGTPRLRAMGWQSLTRLLPQLALAGGGAALLYFLAGELPRDSQRRAGQQLKDQVLAFDAAVAALDVTEARYRESQLEILAPPNIATYRAQMKKVALLHSLFTRPGQLHTEQGLAGLVAEVADVEAAFRATRARATDPDPLPDPDVMIAKAYILWQVGGSRDDEYEAAGLCAAALRSPTPARLAPLARNYIQGFLADPYSPHDSNGPSIDEITGVVSPAKRPDETPPRMIDVRANEATAPAAAAVQFARVIELDQMILELDRDSTAAYLDMIAAHAELRAALKQAGRGSDPAAAQAARAARTAAAKQLIAAWAKFDRGLDAAPELASDAIVLTVFTLDDAVLTHARYWAEKDSTNDFPPILTGKDSTRALSLALRAQIAPLRVAWEKRYASLLGPKAREIVSYQETARFAAFEQRAVAFETAYADFVVAKHGSEPRGRLLELATAAATRASEMGLYRGSGDSRVREASRILADLGTRGEQAPKAVQEAIEQNYQLRRLRLL